jgi:hypothetical protein
LPCGVAAQPGFGDLKKTGVSGLNRMQALKPIHPQSFACIRIDDVPASLELRKIYPVLPDPQLDATGMLRAIDESGYDYLYPRNWFVPINANQELRSALEAVTA